MCNILYPLQYGFRTTRSCETKFLEFIEDVTKNMANSVQTYILIVRIALTTTCSMILQHIHVRDIGLYFSGQYLEPFL
jgi:hypothetical protein